MTRRSNRPNVLVMIALVLMTVGGAIAEPLPRLKTLVNFTGANGANPINETLVEGASGHLYGTTNTGGLFDWGAVFKITRSGTLTTLYSFCQQQNCADGSNPVGGLVLGKDGNFYGTTIAGGDGVGTIFRITPEGALTTLHRFVGSDGAYPSAALVQANDGNFYGTASGGGESQFCGSFGCGTVFRISPEGKFRTLHSFDLADGAESEAALIQAADGHLYGTTFQGGDSSYGTVFKITRSGKFTSLHSFSGGDGEYPNAPLLETKKGLFYGTAAFGGTNGYGTIFTMKSDGALTTLHDFTLTDGYVPSGTLVQVSNGNLYGTTESGGSGHAGTLFTITPAGKLTTLHAFCLLSHCADGADPDGGLLRLKNGIFYGTTYGGGTGLVGTVFSVTGLDPFGETVSTLGGAGKTHH